MSNLEKVIALQIQNVLEEVDYLDSFQPGFRLGYSTDTLLITDMPLCITFDRLRIGWYIGSGTA